VTAFTFMVLALLIPSVSQASLVPTGVEAEFFELLNAARIDAGVGPLEPMDELVSGARLHAHDMLRAGFIFHSSDLSSVLADGWNKLGENVGVGYSAATLHDAFMNSPSHRDNVLDPSYDRVGIGTAELGGVIYVSFVFADLIAVDPSEPMGASGSGRFVDDDGSVFESAIEALAAEGITAGCGPDRFCPDEPVTRGQMAAFLVRALNLPAAGEAGFSDTEGTAFEAPIAALAASGLTSGCGDGRFCPDDPVTRGEMAAFLARGLALPPAQSHPFQDIAGSQFREAIGSLAAAGITSGCTPDRFCPHDPVTRGQMAGFLVRALDL
jgi:hypothetical protein